MTNSSDFRRYSYATDASYALKAFDVQRTNAAPSYVPKPKRPFGVRENTRKKSFKELKREQKAGSIAALKIVGLTLVCVGMLSAMLCSFVQKNELMHEIANIEKQISVADSETTRLRSQLDSLVSVSMIDKYAVEKLGMTKVQSSQIRYVDVAAMEAQRAKKASAEASPKTAKTAAE